MCQLKGKAAALGCSTGLHTAAPAVVAQPGAVCPCCLPPKSEQAPSAPSSQATGTLSNPHQVVESMQVLGSQAVVSVPLLPVSVPFVAGVSVPLVAGSVGSGGSAVQGLLPDVALVHTVSAQGRWAG